MADMQTVVLPDPCLDVLVGGAPRLQTGFALIVFSIGYEGEYVAAYGETRPGQVFRIPALWHALRDSNL